MAGLNVNFDEKARQLIATCLGFDDVLVRLMLGIGKRSLFLLRKMLLSGEHLKFTNYITEGNIGFFSKKGKRRMISSKLLKNKAVIHISSFPLNLFERSRKGYNDKPIYRALLTSKLKNEIENKLTQWAEEYATIIIDKDSQK